ncbi:MAG: PQQ-dependent sugar dehydrogenase [Flavobacteriales bacterium]
MMKRITLLSIFSILSSAIAFAQPSTVTVGSTTLDVRVVFQGTNSSNGIDIPWEIQWGPDDHIWMTERSGRVDRLNPETGVKSIVLDLSSTVYDQSEAGLLGLQLDPDFETNGYVYLAYTYSQSFNVVKERIVRYTYNSGTNSLGSPMTLLDGIEGYSTHIGCRLLILPDNTMLATTGDVREENSLPQDLDELNGKVLRMNLDGSIPADNPFGSSSYVYTYGHRNAQGLVLAPNGILYSSEHGPTTNDEFNIIIPGQNYGWPEVEGFCNQGWETSWCNSQSDYEDPIAIWSENATIAPSDLVWYDHPAIPEWDGKMLMTVLKNKHLKEIEVDMAGTSVVGETIWFQNTFQRLRDILVAPDGRVFLATSGNSWANSAPFTHSIVELKNSSYSPIGIEEGIVSVETKIYPNPSNGMTTISFPREMRGAEYRVVDFTGRVIASGLVTNLNTQLDFSGLASGLYTVQATKGKYATSERLILSK